MLKTPAFQKTVLAAAISLLPAMSIAAVLEEVVVTAQKREQSMQDVPLSVDVLSGEMLRTGKIDSAIDLALATPSINFQQAFSPFGSSFGIRGLNTFALEGGIQPTVSFVVDGVPYARVSEFQSELGDIERIEVLRGPQGTLFGRNATGGAINVVRKKPTQDFEASVEASITDDNEEIYRAMVNGGLTDTITGRVSAYAKNLDGYVENKYPGTEDEGAEDSFGIMAKVNFDLSDIASLLVTADFTRQDTLLSPSVLLKAEDDQGGLGALGLAIGAARTAAVGADVIADINKVNANQSTRADSENWGIAFDLSVDVADSVTLKSITAYREYDLLSVIDVDATPANPSNTMGLPVVGWMKSQFSPVAEDPYSIELNTESFTQELRFEGQTGNVEWIAGGYYQKYSEYTANEIGLLLVDVLFEQGAAAAFSDGIPFDDYYFDANPLQADAEWEGWAIFGDMTVDLTDTLQLFAGLRWTEEDVELDYNRFNYRGPAEAPYFNVLDADNVFIDYDALVNAGLGMLSQETAFQRGDHSEDWSGRIGLNWDVSDQATVYTSASRGFIGSGVNYGRNANRSNSIIAPSIAVSYEIGLKSQLFDDSVRLNGAVFSMTVDDLQTSRLVPGTVNTETFNAGTLKSDGIEADITWAATDLLTVNASATYLDTEMRDLLQPCYPGQSASQGCNVVTAGGTVQDVEGKKALQAPNLSYRVAANLDLPLSSVPFDVFAMLSYTWRDDVQVKLTYDPLTEIEAYGLTDIAIGIRDQEGRYEVTLFGKNIADENFANNIDAAEASIGRQYIRPARQANAYFGIKANYNFF